MDFLSRIRPREDEFLHLADSGSLDSLKGQDSRAALLWTFYAWKKTGGRQMPGLFDVPAEKVSLPEFPPDPPRALLRREFNALGFLCRCHPMALFEQEVREAKGVKARDLHHHIGKTICFAGWLITGKTVKTKQGDPMKFLTFEDETGIVETVFFPKPYARFCHMLDYGRPYVLKGRVESDWDALTLTVETSGKLPSKSTKL
jgi:DNA polymerase III alpha subunit